MTDWTATSASGPLTGEIRPPSDKSISHRAIMLGGLASGTSHVARPLMGADTLSTMAAMEAFGAKVSHGDGNIEVTGTGELASPEGVIDCGNAGTLIRLICGAVCGRNVTCVLDGDESLRKRPMARITEPLSQMGAKVSASPDGTPPLAVEAVDKLRRIEYTLPTASAQVKSAILLAGLVADEGAKVIEPVRCRDHTELILPSFGATVTREGDEIEVTPCLELRPAEIEVPADISAAAFFIVAATIVPGSDLLLREVCVNPTRTGVIDIMRKMGASIEVIDERQMGKEKVADLRVRHADLHGVELGAADVPGAIDELPVVLAAAGVADGTTRLQGAEELRTKESDRLAAMAQALSALGVVVVEHPDGIEVTGGKVSGGAVDSCGDHRIAMSMATLALLAEAPVSIADCDNVATSFPNFVEATGQVGWSVSEQAQG